MQRYRHPKFTSNPNSRSHVSRRNQGLDLWAWVGRSQQQHRPKASPIFWAGCMGASLLLNAASSVAQASKVVNPAQGLPTAIQFNPPTPPDLGAPKGRTLGGSSRGVCPDYPRMKAIMPQIADQSAWGLTTATHPTFWFYLPERPETGIPIEFVLQAPDDAYVYKTNFKLFYTDSGIISITPPENAPPLNPGVQYAWTMSMGCPQSPDSQIAFLRGFVQRSILPESVNQLLKQANELDTAKIYAENGFWYDAVTTLARAHRTQPLSEPTTSLWTRLLEQGGLQDLQSVSLSPCCSNEMRQVGALVLFHR